jgi:inhibitor of cysteine peptidase
LRTANDGSLVAEDQTSAPFAFYRVLTIQNIISLNEADNGSTVQLAPGDVLEVTLEANPSTGFTWEVSPEPTNVNQMSEPGFVPGGGLGAPGKMIFDFESIALGTGQLTLIYHQPFRPDVPPAQTFPVTVNTLP